MWLPGKVPSFREENAYRGNRTHWHPRGRAASESNQPTLKSKNCSSASQSPSLLGFKDWKKKRKNKRKFWFHISKMTLVILSPPKAVRRRGWGKEGEGLWNRTQAQQMWIAPITVTLCLSLLSITVINTMAKNISERKGCVSACSCSPCWREVGAETQGSNLEAGDKTAAMAGAAYWLVLMFAPPPFVYYSDILFVF